MLTGITADSLNFGMSSNNETHKIFPFDFDFSIRFQLEGNKIRVIHRVINTGNSLLLFSLGGHPGFKCPIQPDEKYEDYYLEFEVPENSSTWLLHENGTVLDKTAPVFNGFEYHPAHS